MVMIRRFVSLLFILVIGTVSVAATEPQASESYDYRVLATTKTSTMQKELSDAGEAGFQFVGVTVSKTAFGGKEVVSILRKRISQ